MVFKDPDYNGPFRKKGVVSQNVAENSDWSQDTESVASTMKRRLGDGDVPPLQVGPIIESADRFFELGVYFHNPFSFSGWSKEVKNSGGRFCVLGGDAAHAMPPFLGQGSNQVSQV